MKTQSFYSRGKILLSGEYFILDGAEGVALPTRKGQSLTATACAKSRRPLLHWNSFDCEGERWFHAQYDRQTLDIVDTPPTPENQYLQKILRQARQKNDDFLHGPQEDIRVETRLEFPRQWGLGSSSTLTALIAQWAHICPLELAFETSSGSGYDIACAGEDGPIIYRRPHWKKIPFNPPFQDSLFIVPLKRKCSSSQSIEYYRQRAPFPEKIVTQSNQLTDKLLRATDLTQFQQALTDGESFVSHHLLLTPVKARLFADFDGAIKSLGSWGGDCVLAASSLPARDTVAYFAERGYSRCIPWREMVCTP